MNSEYLQKLQKSYQEAVDWSAQANVRYGSTSGTSSDKSVSNAVDKALANPGISHSASETKGKTGVSGSGSFRMGGSFGGSSAPGNSTSPSSSNPSSPKASKGNGEPVPTFGTKKMPEKKLSLKMDTMSDIDTYNLVLEYLLDEGFASTEQAADKIILNMSEAWFEDIMELNRLEREQGKESGGTSDPAMRIMKKKLRDMQGKPEGQRKKEPGKKPPKAGEYGGPASPAQKVAKRRADKKRGEEMMHSARD